MQKNKVLKSKRECGECTLCCQYMSAEVYGHRFSKGNPCHYLGNGCTIYKDRPSVCSDYKCFWLEDVEHFVPEWIKPSLSGIIITKRRWGKNKDKFYWAVVECGKPMRAEVLHWLLTFCEQNHIELEYEFNFRMHRKGSQEFQMYIEESYNQG